MAKMSLQLPRISSLYRNAGDPSNLIIEGQNHLHGKGSAAFTGPLENTRKTFVLGEMKRRSLTARSYIAHPNTWTSEHNRGKNKENIRAQTAGGCLSADEFITQNYSVNELFVIIKEKLSNSPTYIQKMFRNNDPKGQGKISREALTRVLWNICGILTTQQINNLLNRLHLLGHSSVSFEDFKKCFQNDKVTNTDWLNPTSAKHLKKNTEKSKCTQAKDEGGNADSAWNSLVDHVQKSKSLHKYLPSSCLCPSGLVTFTQFVEALKPLGVELSDKDLATIWTRFGSTTGTAVPSITLFNKLRLPFPCSTSSASNAMNPCNQHSYRKIEDVIRAIKGKLNEACTLMFQEFSKMDTSASGLICRSTFRLGLSNFDVPMTAVDLEHLLARFNLRRKDGLVDYDLFINKLNGRSHLSFMTRMMEEAKDRLDCYSVGVTSNKKVECLSASDAEQKLFQMCHGRFLQLLVEFGKADVHRNGFVRYEDFRRIIEKTMDVHLTDQQVTDFATLLGEQDATNILPYRDFLALIQDRPTTFELTEEIEKLSSAIKVRHRLDKIRYRKSIKMDLSRYNRAQTPRNLQELYSIVWDLLQSQFWQFCKVFISICRNDDCAADKEKLDAIFLRMNIVLLPGELEKLWSSLPLTYPVQSIALRKLLSYFVNIAKPNDSGPKKWNPVESIQAKLASDIVKYWSEIKAVVKTRDPHGTGCVSFPEICAVFQALKLDVGPVEFDTLCQAFDVNQDGNFHYLPFLKFYVKKNVKSGH